MDFDWQKAPEANPSSMAFYMYNRSDGFNPIRFIFQNKNGDRIKVMSGEFHALCLNADLTDWAVLEGEDNVDTYRVSTTDQQAIQALRIPTRALPRAEGASDERIAKTPGYLWADRQNDIILPQSYESKTITMYPEEKNCHYIVDVYDSGDVSLYPKGVDASLSGMAEAYVIGKDSPSEERVTHTFVLTPVLSDNSLHAEFLTFGDAVNSDKHIISLFLIKEDGTPWTCNVDVTKTIHEAPDPHHVHIILRGIDLPKPDNPDNTGGTFGLIPNVDDWQSVNIDLKM